MKKEFNPVFEHLKPITNLHYAKETLTGDIPEIRFDSVQSLIDASVDEMNEVAGEMVFVIAIGGESFATENVESAEAFISALLEKYKNCSWSSDVWILEFKSFEEAYKYKLDLKEGQSGLCYYDEDKESEQASDE